MEAEDLARSVDELHFLLELLNGRDSVDRGRFIRSAQAIDIVGQRLLGLSIFVAELASAAPPEWMLNVEEARRKLSLSALAGRLAGQDAMESIAAHAPGDLDLF